MNKPTSATNIGNEVDYKHNHGTCNKCGFELNGKLIYSHFIREYKGDWKKALSVASMYGATMHRGRFSKAIYVKPYDEKGNKMATYYKCPECGGKCYE